MDVWSFRSCCFKGCLTSHKPTITITYCDCLLGSSCYQTKNRTKQLGESQESSTINPLFTASSEKLSLALALENKSQNSCMLIMSTMFQRFKSHFNKECSTVDVQRHWVSQNCYAVHFELTIKFIFCCLHIQLYIYFLSCERVREHCTGKWGVSAGGQTAAVVSNLLRGVNSLCDITKGRFPLIN